MDIFKIIIAFLNLPRLIPHLVFFFKRNNILKDDIYANYRGRKHSDVVIYMLLLVFKKPFRNIVYHRMGKSSYLFKWMLSPYETFILDNQMFIGGGLCAGHSFATVVNANRIGKNFTVFQNVTVGVSNGGKPTIGDNVAIYTHSVIVGNISIGNNVVIGASTLINKNIPDNCIVVGNPARIIKLNGEKVNISL